MKLNILICARGGSKKLKKKNIKNFNGKPLIYWTIDMAKKIKGIQNIYVSTDSSEIATISKSFGALVPFLRPKKLASDDAKEWDVWKHAVNFFHDNDIKSDGLVILPVTSPLRRLKDVNQCIKEFKKKQTNVITVTESHRNPHFNMVKKTNKYYDLVIYKKKYYNRQSVPKTFDVTTNCFILKTSTILSDNFLYDSKVTAIEVPKKNSIDIDDIYDFKIAEFLSKYKKL